MARTYGHGTAGQHTSRWCCNTCKHFFKNEVARNKEKSHAGVHTTDVVDALRPRK